MALDPQARALLDAVEQSGSPALNTLSAVDARALYDKGAAAVQGSPPQPQEITTLAIPGPAGDIPARVYKPGSDSGLPVLIYFHGGGYVIGSLESHDCVCRTLCVEANCIVVAVDYRLAPEHKYPAAIDDCWAATRWLAENAGSLGGDIDRVAVGGDSAGGNLAAVVCLKAKAAGGPRLVHQLLIYPGTDMSCSFASHETFGQGYRLTNELIDWFYALYFEADSDINHWQASPLNADDLSGLPPALVLSAGFDPLQDEDKAYADKLAQAGVQVKYSHYETMLHGFIAMPGALDQAKEALSECAVELRNAFA